jgi:hypothetical protein
MCALSQHAPWINKSYSLVSWWQMEQFSAAAFMYVSRCLSDLRVTFSKLPPGSPLTRGSDDGRYQLVTAIHDLCDEIGLRTSVLCTEDILNDLGRGTTVGKMTRSLTELDNTIRREMSTHWFFHLEESRAAFYMQNELFGVEVNAKFPSIAFDMVEAGNCYAMGRGTACVFHLMRIMEVGVQAFGAKLGVALAHEKNWQNILDEVNKAIRALPPKGPTTVQLSQISSNLYAVKLAWRNEVMHPHDTYTLEEAENLITQVKLFMEQLTTFV